MSKVIIHATMSVDGYIAGPNDDMSWLSDYFGPNALVDEIVKNVGAIVSGGRLFRSMENNPEGNLPYGGAIKAPVFILTRQLREAVTIAGVRFQFTDHFGSAIEQAKSAAGDKNVMLFGSTMARMGLQARVVDELVIHLAPLLLGDGIRLFDQTGAGQIKLEKIEVADAGKVTNLHYRILK